MSSFKKFGYGWIILAVVLGIAFYATTAIRWQHNISGANFTSQDISMAWNSFFQTNFGAFVMFAVIPCAIGFFGLARLAIFILIPCILAIVFPWAQDLFVIGIPFILAIIVGVILEFYHKRKKQN